MNSTQAMIILTNGIKKYGTIINGSNENRIQFIPSMHIHALAENQLSQLVEHIPVSTILSIDTYLK
jgi:hypothetical protein